MKLGETGEKFSNNLQLSRFIAAILVIVSHSFILSTGEATGEWLRIITNGQVSMGSFAVSLFFLCGGFLSIKSMEKAKTGTQYWKNRVKKIFPPLWFVVIICIVVGSSITGLSYKEYWSNSQTWKYILNGVLIPIHNLPGVFENNIGNSTINGALWTLPVEVMCYVGCFLLYKLGLLKEKKVYISVPIMLIVWLLFSLIGRKISIVNSMIQPMAFFYVGMLFYVYRNKIELDIKYVIIAICGLVVTCILQILDIGMILFLPYIMFWFWYGCKWNCKVGFLGNYSYGMYLWGYPVQQYCIWMSGDNMK